MSKRKSQTDWSRVEAVKESDPIPYSPEDGPYDPNQAGETEAYLSAAIVSRPGQRGKQKSATKQLVSLRLSAAVLEYFKSTGPGWQGRIDEVLKKAAEQRNTTRRLAASGGSDPAAEAAPRRRTAD
jgi:uncharacterized protein (DUF4415 family)